ncbi:MAG TPA: hypothetical protein VHO91_21330, partial [Rhodopila sp.]|nr:hypothetical protein [Rhodopila sp.]
MKRLNAVKLTLLCATALGSVMAVQPAAAQSATQMDSIEKQIQSLQTELKRMKADAAARDRALKQAQEQAKAAQAQAAAAHTQATQTAAQVAAAPPPAPVPAEPKLPQGSFRVGQVTVTLGGFAAMEGLYRSRNEAASIDTSFGGIPLPNNPNYHVPEFRTTAQQSRFSLLAQ